MSSNPESVTTAAPPPDGADSESGDVDTFCEAGRKAIRAGEYDTGVEAYAKAVAADGASKDAVWGLADAWHYAGNKEKAARWYGRYLELAPGDPEASHMLASLGAIATPPRAGDAYVRGLFDNFASDFDRLLVDELYYKAPDHIFTEVTPLLPPGARDLNILDLGCGTGLAGEKFRPLARYLTGIDLSREMIKKARARRIYDSLRAEDITQALHRTKARYDLVVASDVLVYFGDLEEILHAVANVLADGGMFAFSVETWEEPDFALTDSGRYAHNPDYVEMVAARCGLVELSGQDMVLRLESGQPVDGYVTVYASERSWIDPAKLMD